MIINPRWVFLNAVRTHLRSRLPDYTVSLFADMPDRAEQCPLLCLDYIGDASATLATGSRNRRQRVVGTLSIRAHRWVDANGNHEAAAEALMAEYDRIFFATQNLFLDMGVEGLLPDGLTISGTYEIKGKTFTLATNSMDYAVSATFLIQNLPLEFLIKEN